MFKKILITTLFIPLLLLTSCNKKYTVDDLENNAEKIQVSGIEPKQDNSNELTKTYYMLDKDNQQFKTICEKISELEFKKSSQCKCLPENSVSIWYKDRVDSFDGFSLGSYTISTKKSDFSYYRCDLDKLKEIYEVAKQYGTKSETDSFPKD